MISSGGIDDLPGAWDREELAIRIVKPAKDKEKISNFCETPNSMIVT